MTTNSSYSPRQNAILIARQKLTENPVYLDTETTGLGAKDEIVEVSVVNDDNSILFQSFARPSKSIPLEATRVHGITNEMVEKAPTWPLVWTQLRPLLTGKLVVIYNADFDVKMMQQSYTQYRLPWRDSINAFCLMKLYAQYRGNWDRTRGNYIFTSLDRAGKQCGIDLPNAHRATADSLLARALLHYLAEQA